MTTAHRVLIAVGVVALALAAGFTAGRFSAPERVEYRALDLKTEDITRGYTFAKQVQVTRWRNVVTVSSDAGVTITDRTVEREGSAEASESREELKRVEVVERERVVTVRPQWRVTGLVGASVMQPLFQITGPLVVGGSVEHRIAGGVSAGGWIIPQLGAGGLVVSGEF